MLNHVVIYGRITREPELKRTNNGVPVTSFSVACERDYKNGGGDRETDFFDVLAWRTKAEFFCNYFHKGSAVIVDGRLQTSSWEDNNGQKRRGVEIVAENIYFGDSKRSNGGDTSNTAEPMVAVAEADPATYNDGDLPF